ncbi:MAG: c-type cytochrome biogenesis protein CcmI [Xanthobacteraceae bacterium]
MTLWFVLAMMTAAAAFAVLWPLGRRQESNAGGSDIPVYRDQLDEIERDRAAGRIGEAEAEAAKVEVSRRLLAAADKGMDVPASSSLWRRRAVALAALILLPAVSGGLYLALGSPSLPGQPLAARLSPPERAPVAQLVAQVEAHLEKNPQDGRGWEVLAPVYMQLGRFDDAARAWRNAATYSGSTAERESNLGEALTAGAKGVVTADAKSAFERALALEANDAKARYFLGLAAEQDGRKEEAAAIWRNLLASAPPDAPWTDFVRASLARVGGTPAAMPPGPSDEDVAAAAALSPEERQQMIRGMVEGLASRLKNDGNDIEGWLRLVRAYTVLGERDKARAAAADARRASEGDPEKIRRLDELIKNIGLEG